MKTINYILILFLLSAVICASCENETAFRDFGIDTTITNLVDQNNKKFDLEQICGNVAWVYFGYTHCPDFCPATHGKLTRAWKKTGFRKNKIKTIFITVDPQRDSSELLSSYISNFEMPAIGLTGEMSDIESVAKRYGIYFERVPFGKNGQYGVNHTTSVYLLDSGGKLRYIFPYKASANKIAEITKILVPLF